MTYCPKCGWMNADEAAYCQKCGGSLTVERAPDAVRPVGSQFDRSFRGAGPLLKAFIGFVFILLVVEMLNALSDDSTFADRFGDFLADNLLLIFLILLLAAYSGYFSRRYRREYSILSPLVAAIIITFILWVVANVMDLLGRSQGVSAMETMSDLLFSILYIIFLLVLLIGYIGVVMRVDRPTPPPMSPSAPVLSEQPPQGQPMGEVPPYVPGPQPSPSYVPPRRLGRSSRDKVLFGVCGGMAEYFNTDPFLIRALWVVGAVLSFGAFVLAYLIIGIILPKNP
jgi:phage shock protein C